MDEKTLYNILHKLCEGNTFTKSLGGYYTSDDPFLALDQKLSICFCKDLEELRKNFIMYDAWRVCLVYKDLVFVNQTVGGGWEAWTLKIFGDEIMPFESISMRLIIEDGTHDGMTFEEYIEKLNSLSKYQVEHYMEICLEL